MLHTYSLIYSTEQPDHPGAWKREGDTGTSGHNSSLASLQASALVPGSTNLTWGTKGDTG